MISRSFNSLAPLIRPAPGATWAPRARWYAINTNGRKEFVVASAIEALEHPVYVPLDFRPRKKIRGKEPDPVPLCPRIVFAMTELSGWAAIRNLDHVTGFECDADGFPEPIPDDQMETFRRVHGEWLADAQKRAALGKAIQGRGARGRKRSVPFLDGLKQLQRDMEGKG